MRTVAREAKRTGINDGIHQCCMGQATESVQSQSHWAPDSTQTDQIGLVAGMCGMCFQSCITVSIVLEIR